MKVNFMLYCLFLGNGRGGGGGGDGYLLLTWECPENKICFSIMKISHNPVEEGWGRLEKSSARPTSIFYDIFQVIIPDIQIFGYPDYFQADFFVSWLNIFQMCFLI